MSYLPAPYSGKGIRLLKINFAFYPLLQKVDCASHKTENAPNEQELSGIYYSFMLSYSCRTA